MKTLDKTIWDYDIKNMDLKKPAVLKWYLERKINSGDWQNIRAIDLKKYFERLSINPEIKNLLRAYFKQE